MYTLESIFGGNAQSSADRRGTGAISTDVEAAHDRNRGGVNTNPRTRVDSAGALRKRHGITLGRLDSDDRATHRGGDLLAGLATRWSIRQARLATGELSCVLLTIGQAAYTEYYDYLHAQIGTVWPSDVLVFFWVVPIVMTLFLTPRDGNSDYQWLRVCDFTQVCALVLAVELSQIYVPSRWQLARQAMQNSALHAGIFFFGLIAVSFLVRAALAANHVEKAFFWRMGALLTVYAAVSNGTLYYQASGHYQQGQWTDLPWTVVDCLLILLA